MTPFACCFYNMEDEGYAVVSEYFGRGLFNKLTLITDAEPAPAVHPAPPAPAHAPAPAPTPAPTYGPGAEAKLRLEEGQSKQLYVLNAPNQTAPKGTSVVPIPEGRIRLQEAHRYSNSLEANVKTPPPLFHERTETLVRSSPVITRKTSGLKKPDAGAPGGRDVSPKARNISSAISNTTNTNPFEDAYDESKNPFADEAGGPSNPFEEDEDYDKNLNPFT
ncbi:hypothetical protein EVAR_103005_1 [Eumeta japonica]|uniref:Uncharacterized protein n=1 Tax=Eumeta variegata TaxID=151549 RepID=A0A4C1UPN6_EUMVA|nr:hypothetical protein EVAR_103005_1 [Eumeta japonica]